MYVSNHRLASWFLGLDTIQLIDLVTNISFHQHTVVSNSTEESINQPDPGPLHPVLSNHSSNELALTPNSSHALCAISGSTVP